MKEILKFQPENHQGQRRWLGKLLAGFEESKAGSGVNGRLIEEVTGIFMPYSLLAGFP